MTLRQPGVLSVLLPFSLPQKKRLALAGLFFCCTGNAFSVFPAHAQVSTNLDALPNAPASQHKAPASSSAPSDRTARRETKRHEAARQKTGERVKSVQSPASRSLASRQSSAPLPKAPSQQHAFTTVPAIPSKPPKPVVIAPPFGIVLLHPPVAPEPVATVATAKSEIVSLPAAAVPTSASVPASSVSASTSKSAQTTNGSGATSGKTVSSKVVPDKVVPENDGLRVLFPQGSADMNAETIARVRKMGEALAETPNKRIMLRAYASLPGDGVSLPRRIALQRALAIRSLLIESGVATTRIYPIAFGRPASDDHAPGDRLDIVTEENPAPAVTPVPGEPLADDQPYDPLLSPIRYPGRNGSSPASSGSPTNAPASKGASAP